jgi:hypothetical protein
MIRKTLQFLNENISDDNIKLPSTFFCGQVEQNKSKCFLFTFILGASDRHLNPAKNTAVIFGRYIQKVHELINPLSWLANLCLI